jgi:hypothetical protein
VPCALKNSPLSEIKILFNKKLFSEIIILADPESKILKKGSFKNVNPRGLCKTNCKIATIDSNRVNVKKITKKNLIIKDKFFLKKGVKKIKKDKMQIVNLKRS